VQCVSGSSYLIEKCLKIDVSHDDVSTSVLKSSSRCTRVGPGILRQMQLWYDTDDVCHIQCPGSKLHDGGLQRLHSADDVAINQG